LIRPGRTALIGLALCLLPALAIPFTSQARGWLSLFLLAWLALVLFALQRLPRASHLAVEFLPMGTARLGEPISVSLRLTNIHYRVVALSVWLQPPASASGRPAPRCRLAAGEEILLLFEIVPGRRGLLASGSLHLKLRGFWGLLERVEALPGSQEIAVHARRLPLRISNAIAPALLPRRRLPSSDKSLFAGLRPLLPQEDARDLCWSATARCGQPMTRTWERPKEGPVLFLLDRGSGMAVAMDRGESRLDRATSLVNGLARQLTRSAHPVGMASFASQLEHWVAPRAAVLPALGRALISLEAAPHPWQPDRVPQLLAPRITPQTTVVLVTEPDGDPRPLSQALAVLARRFPVVVLSLGDPALQAATRRPVEDVADAYRLSAALALVEERRLALREWSRSGARVVDLAALLLRLPMTRYASRALASKAAEPMLNQAGLGRGE